MSVSAPATLHFETNAPIPTWFKVGGRAARLARPRSVDDLRQCLALDPGALILGDGANLLVDDDGIDALVVAMHEPRNPRFPLALVDWTDGSRPTYARAGASLFAMCPEAARRGLAGLENLGGIPATLGGAIVMNAGGKFGEIASIVHRVHALDRQGHEHWLPRSEIAFSYRHSGLNHLIILGAELNLTPDDPARVRARLKDVMEYKKTTQPMDANSAGCAFKNPTLTHDLKDIAPAGTRVSAGLLIDRAGCKGLRIGSAEVSTRHGNFLFAHHTEQHPGQARDVIALIAEVQRRVHDAFGVRLDREVVIWQRS